jgi:integrase
VVSVRFYHEREHIYLVYFVDVGKKVKVLIHSGVKAAEWNKNKQRCNFKHKHGDEINSLLDALRDFVEKTVIDYKLKGSYLTADVLKGMIRQRIGGTPPSAFRDYAEAWIEAHRDRVAKYSYYNIRRSIIVFLDMYPDLTFNSIDRAWHQRTMAALNKEYKPNTVYKYFKYLRKLMKEAHIEGLHTNVFYQSHAFCGAEEEVDNVYLTIEDIRTIYNALDHVDDRLRNVGVLFLRACLSGVRYGSLDSLDKAMRYNIGDKEMISFITNKTAAKVSIPLSPMLKRLMDMDAHLISNQKMNNYIKEMLNNLNIRNANQITVHTARRTFASNMVLAGMDVPTIMAITGHKTERVFWKYVKLQPDMRAVAGSDILSKLFA